jgi:hypothetical protein
MWISLGAAAAALAMIVAARLLRSRTKERRIDVGRLSDAWLAEQRGRSRDE